ncbi:sulfatase family protein [Planctomicrobium sp. SH664]|uniref:sulfatase family protein n=1 Tax=Planctomicrobium sp. SH664 TaxID=3448125 RepID=UPI003F5B805F
MKIFSAALSCALAIVCTITSQTMASERPNIVWINVDDMSPHFSCYGEQRIQTPHVDELAKEGTLFRNAFVTAPVCSASRSASITGMYQTSIGAQNHRSSRGDVKIYLPEGVEPLPVLFKRAGYYTAVGSPEMKPGKQMGKLDYNFVYDESMYDGNDWSGRKPGQPFFMQVQLHGGKSREGNSGPADLQKALGTLTSPDVVTLPPYYPNDPLLLADWAYYLDAVRKTDAEVGDVIKRLKSEGIYDQTVVIFTTDHGISHARGKQFLYDEGIHVPLVIRGPGVPRNTVRDDLVEHIDMAATSLARAGIAIPAKMQARDLLATNYQPRQEVFAARDRCDETVDRIRSVRTADFKYIRNGYPARPHLQPNRYKDSKPIVRQLRKLHEEGKLNDLQERLLFSESRPAEELYDLKSDPYETVNLAADPKYQTQLLELRQRLDRWQEETNDLGRVPESEASYDANTIANINSKGGGDKKTLRRNIELMKKWAAEGK